MKIFKHLLLTAALVFAAGGCSFIKTDAPDARADNSAAANSAGAGNAETAQADSAAETGLGNLQFDATDLQKAEPEAVVRDLYKVHDQDMKGNKDRILNSKNRAMLDKYFDKTLADYIWKDLTTERDDVGVLDFDPFYNAQDFDIKNFAVGQTKIEGNKASVPVSFTNAGRKDKLTYTLARQSNSAWKITDIKYTDGSSLVGYFKEAAKNESSAADGGGGDARASGEEGMFEGTYQIGSTTATVKPIKMAFELKWAKGAGTMIFFYEGEGVLKYVSEDKGNGVDAFVFDDTTFTTGKFIRGSDGKEMPVKKIK